MVILGHLGDPFLGRNLLLCLGFLKIHDLDNSFISILQTPINPYLKKLVEIYHSVDNRVLFRAWSNFGLGLTCISVYSIDTSKQKWYLSNAYQNSKFKRVWRSTNISAVINAEVSLSLKFPTPSSNQIIGFGNFNLNPSVVKKKMVTFKAKHFKESKRIIYSLTLSTPYLWKCKKIMTQDCC